MIDLEEDSETLTTLTETPGTTQHCYAKQFTKILQPVLIILQPSVCQYSLA